MACYKARGFLQKAESLGLTALGLGRECLGFAMTRSTMLPKCTSTLGQTFSIRDVAAEGDCDWGTCRYKTARTGTQKG